jgi:hypothetical protein
MLKSGKSVTVDAMQSALKIKNNSIMVLIYQLRTHLGADIESERQGRKVVSYRLSNAADIEPKLNTVKPSKARKTSTKVAKVAVAKTKTTVSRKAKVAKEDEFDVPTLDADLDITEVSDAELADLRNQLGL